MTIDWQCDGVKEIRVIGWYKLECECDRVTEWWMVKNERINLLISKLSDKDTLYQSDKIIDK